MATFYSEKELREIAKDTKIDWEKQSGQKAKLRGWQVMIDGPNTCLTAIITTRDGLTRQVHCAI